MDMTSTVDRSLAGAFIDYSSFLVYVGHINGDTVQILASLAPS